VVLVYPIDGLSHSLYTHTLLYLRLNRSTVDDVQFIGYYEAWVMSGQMPRRLKLTQARARHGHSSTCVAFNDAVTSIYVNARHSIACPAQDGNRDTIAKAYSRLLANSTNQPADDAPTLTEEEMRAVFPHSDSTTPRFPTARLWVRTRCRHLLFCR
jgi:hypothetical protein